MAHRAGSRVSRGKGALLLAPFSFVSFSFGHAKENIISRNHIVSLDPNFISEVKTSFASTNTSFKSLSESRNRGKIFNISPSDKLYLVLLYINVSFYETKLDNEFSHLEHQTA